MWIQLVLFLQYLGMTSFGPHGFPLQSPPALHPSPRSLFHHSTRDKLDTFAAPRHLCEGKITHLGDGVGRNRGSRL